MSGFDTLRYMDWYWSLRQVPKFISCLRTMFLRVQKPLFVRQQYNNWRAFGKTIRKRFRCCRLVRGQTLSGQSATLQYLS